jgi:hypothetical protein
MAIRITGIRLSGGTGHEHITTLWWIDPARNVEKSSRRATIVAWIDDEQREAYVHQPGTARSTVGTVDPGSGRSKYLRTYADGQWNNNLLSLPRK